MYRYTKPLGLIIILTVIACWFLPDITAHAGTVKTQLIHFKKYCLANTWTGYLLYVSILSTILLAGLPVATVAMLLAGVIYGFWEVATLVTLCRLLAAILTFLIARQLIGRPSTRPFRTPYLIRKFEHHPKIALMLVRLMPIPDSVVNYTIAASTISHRDYVVLSLIGMIPFTLLCVWMGQELGTISSFVRYIK